MVFDDTFNSLIEYSMSAIYAKTKVHLPMMIVKIVVTITNNIFTGTLVLFSLIELLNFITICNNFRSNSSIVWYTF